MRKNLKSLAPILWGVIIAFIISIFAVWGGAGRLGEGRRQNTIAKVGKQKISRDFYYSSLVQRLQTMSKEYQNLDANLIQQLNIPQQILEQIIQRTLLLQKAKEMGLSVSDDEIAAKIISYPVFQKDGKFIGFSQYQKILNWNHISISEFEQSLKNEILIDKVVKSVTSGVFATEEEAWKSFKNNAETARIEYAVLDTNKVKLDKEPSDSALEEYYNGKKAAYRLPERREADFVFIQSDELKPEIEISPGEISKYYKANETQFKEPEQTRVSRIYFAFENKDKELVRTQAKTILGRLKKNEDFGTLAEIYSEDDKASAKGDWGLFEWRNLPPKEQEAINNLGKGEHSDLIETENGTAILKVTEKEPEKLSPLEEVSARITDILKDKKARDTAEKQISHLEKTTKKEGSLDAAAQKMGYKMKKTGLLKQGDPLKDIDPSGSISSSLFSLTEGGITSPVFTYKGIGLAQLKKIDPPRPAAFNEVKEQVKKDFLVEKKKDSALQKIKNLQKQIRGDNLEKLAEKFKMEYKTVEEHKRGQYLGTIGENKTVDRLAFSLNINKLSDPIEYESGYAVMRVLDRKSVTKDNFAKQKKSAIDKLLETKKNEFFQSYLMKMRKDKNVKIRYDIFLKVNTDILARFTKEQS